MAKYQENRTRYVEFAGRMEDLIRQLVKKEKVEVVQIESRVKEIDSFAEKIDRKGKSYSDPLFDITDLVGIRIIAYYQEDVEPISRLINREFHIDDNNSVDKSSTLKLDQFGYLSTHFVVSIKSSRAALSEWSFYAGMKAEIQVRTALQHAWAAVDHKLSYKAAVDIPESLRRRLFRLSALFELADEEFSAIRKQREELIVKSAGEVGSGDLSAGVDATTIVGYLSTREDEILNIVQLGPWYVGEIPDAASDDINDLLKVLRVLAIHTIAELDQVIGHDPYQLAYELRAIRDRIGSRITGTSLYDVVTAILLLHLATDEVRDNLDYIDEYWDAIFGAQEDCGYN